MLHWRFEYTAVLHLAIDVINLGLHGPLTRYAELRAAHASGMPGMFSPPPTSKETASWRFRHASRHVRHARAVMHVGIANPQWHGKRSRHSRRIRNSQLYVSGKRAIHFRSWYKSCVRPSSLPKFYTKSSTSGCWWRLWYFSWNQTRPLLILGSWSTDEHLGFVHCTDQSEQYVWVIPNVYKCVLFGTVIY